MLTKAALIYLFMFLFIFLSKYSKNSNTVKMYYHLK